MIKLQQLKKTDLRPGMRKSLLVLHKDLESLESQVQSLMP